MSRFITFALALFCLCTPSNPEPACALTPTCVLDAPGQPPAPAGTPCGDGTCDGAGLCCPASNQP